MEVLNICKDTAQGIGWGAGDLCRDKLRIWENGVKRGAGKTHFVQTVARPSLNAIFPNPSLSSLRIPCTPPNSLSLRVAWLFTWYIVS